MVNINSFRPAAGHVQTAASITAEAASDIVNTFMKSPAPYPTKAREMWATMEGLRSSGRRELADAIGAALGKQLGLSNGVTDINTPRFSINYLTGDTSFSKKFSKVANLELPLSEIMSKDAQGTAHAAALVHRSTDSKTVTLNDMAAVLMDLSLTTPVYGITNLPGAGETHGAAQVVGAVLSAKHPQLTGEIEKALNELRGIADGATAARNS